MTKTGLQFVGVELYFDDLAKARQFYIEVLGLKITDEQKGHFAKFDAPSGFVCLERKGAESYPSRDKAALFFEVESLTEIVAAIGQERFVQVEPGWAVMHDTEGHNVLLLQRSALWGLRRHLHEIE